MSVKTLLRTFLLRAVGDRPEEVLQVRGNAFAGSTAGYPLSGDLAYPRPPWMWRPIPMRC